MRRNIDTDLLRTFIAVVDQDGFIRAGQALGRSQSAVSMQMRRLEEAVGSALFRRAGRKMQLTPAGETLLGYARRLVALHDEALDVVQDRQVSGSVSLAVMGDYATNVLPNVLATFIEQYPDIAVDVTTGFSYELIHHLGERFELVLSTQAEGARKGEVLRSEPTRWAFAADRELPGGEVLPLALLPPGNMFREWALQALDRAGRPWRIMFTSTSIATVEAAAEAGIALTVVKEGSARPGLRLIGRREGLPELPRSEIAIHRAPGRLSKAAQTLSDFISDALSN
ncbi:LysR substrate-binding domain-containing protein [Microbaculum marinum]|uniref:LysR substrate-binding domain-containing protein n=1 Tax=Microbaculum marinum TaxID=1764581 RepID=A0AAW9RRC2_9HYPH